MLGRDSRHAFTLRKGRCSPLIMRHSGQTGRGVSGGEPRVRPSGRQMSSRIRTLPLIALLALSLLAPASAAAQDRTITVNGSATQEVPNDTAGLGFQVAKERSSRAAALRIVSTRLRAGHRGGAGDSGCRARRRHDRADLDPESHPRQTDRSTGRARGSP